MPEHPSEGDASDGDASDGDASRDTARIGLPAPVTADVKPALAEAVTLLRDHPLWAIWIPLPIGSWTAIRPASLRPPAPGLPMIWAHATSATELASKMNLIDEQVTGRGWPGPSPSGLNPPAQ